MWFSPVYVFCFVVAILSNTVGTKVYDLPAQITLRVCFHMSPLMLSTMRTPTEGLLANGFSASEAFLTLLIAFSGVFQYDCYDAE